MPAAISLVDNYRQGTAIMHAALFRFFFYFSA
ncbi:TPA: pheST operon leader peptide PheM [Serratia marcescens]|uniref:pheST attenuator peptide n=3 Tax=Enterobacterales TaxID=91347 RepID=A0ABD6HLR0_SERMA|nr:pheST operon leader peptide PheM [Serratia marcescens]HAT2865654.1 pheST operon leader peptide PheM [Serratia marcescens]HAT2870864.1 pheST operon leader peptide PheM [Serratia marcescens]HAT2921540.1 pheST operon leader peptide PheM [Serratia marcescens]